MLSGKTIHYIVFIGPKRPILKANEVFVSRSDKSKVFDTSVVALVLVRCPHLIFALDFEILCFLDRVFNIFMIVRSSVKLYCTARENTLCL